MESADRIFHSTGIWATLDTGAPVPRIGPAMGDIGVRQNLALAVRDDRILAVDEAAKIFAAYQAPHVDLGSRVVVPGFVDAHTHPVFDHTRENEFEMRTMGKTYVDIAKAGGGIRSSVRALRALEESRLVKKVHARAETFLRNGTTTIEAKSGYGLSLESELKSLRVLRQVASEQPLDIIPTFMGAHEFPDEYRDRRGEYIELIIQEMIPRIAEERLAKYCDVFCEDHVFSVAETRRILEAGRRYGLLPRIHADEIESTGGAELAAELGAVSADHLVAVSEQGIQMLKSSGTMPILLPGTSFFLRLAKHAPARTMIDAGLPITLATDFNPGSCPTPSIPMIMTLACLNYRLSAAEALTAVTVNAAASLGLSEDRGRLAPGCRADFIALDLDSPGAIPYHFGDNRVTHVIKNGRLVYQR